MAEETMTALTALMREQNGIAQDTSKSIHDIVEETRAQNEKNKTISWQNKRIKAINRKSNRHTVDTYADEADRIYKSKAKNKKEYKKELAKLIDNLEDAHIDGGF